MFSQLELEAREVSEEQNIDIITLIIIKKQQVVVVVRTYIYMQLEDVGHDADLYLVLYLYININIRSIIYRQSRIKAEDKDKQYAKTKKLEDAWPELWSTSKL